MDISATRSDDRPDLDLDRVRADLEAALEAAREVTDGEPSEYLTEIENPPVDGLAAAVCTAAGDVVCRGDDEQRFALQSVSKALAFAVALEEVGLERIEEHVGIEPSGEAFNHLSLHDDGRPFNPMINAGAIMVHALLPGDGPEDRAARLLDRFSRMAAAELSLKEDVLEAERDLADRNLGLAHLLADAGTLPTLPAEAVEGYLRQCAVGVTVRELAIMGATLAAGGVNPLTDERVLGEDVARLTMTVMLTCGMYDASGQWAAEVGIPAKSGVSGAVLGAVPGALGIATWSPRLDDRGTSTRGIAVFERLSDDWDLHVLRHRDALAGLRVD
ncbi:glutaminase A [Micrococcus sp.]|uniref:glutaminase A n=1 Tax=Micrococcus sp. TaxID=1271 RepID=UPI002A908C5B|nr:glutaminase A [Micrococcus sp.]MDY6054703.1 glutaminase A [Micrococcus sp.]